MGTSTWCSVGAIVTTSLLGGSLVARPGMPALSTLPIPAQINGPGLGHYYRIDAVLHVPFDDGVVVDSIQGYGEVDPADGSVDFGVAVSWLHWSVTPSGMHQPLTAVQRYGTEFEPSAAYIEKIGERHMLFVAGSDPDGKTVAVRFKIGQPTVVWVSVPGGQQARAIIPGALTGLTRLLPASAGLVEPYFAIWPSIDPQEPTAFYGVKMGPDPANGDDFVVEYVRQQGAHRVVVAGTDAPIVDWFTAVTPLVNANGSKIGYRAGLNPFLFKLGVSSVVHWDLTDTDADGVLDTLVPD